MKNLLCVASFAAASLMAAGSTAFAQDREVRIDAASPAAAVVRHFGWLESEFASRGVAVRWIADGAQEGNADFAGADGAAALKARAAGGAVKAVYVLWRGTAGDDRFLLASESFLNGRAQDAQAVIAAFERARLWIAANPEEAARVLPVGATARNLAGSRPGPAQLAVLGEAARRLGLDARLPRELLDDSLVRAVVVGQATR